MIFDFGLSQRRTANDTPVDRLVPLYQMTISNNFSKCTNNIGLYTEIHGQVRVVPVTKNTDSNKVFALPLNLLHRVITTLLSEHRVINFDTSLTNFLFDIVLNR